MQVNLVYFRPNGGRKVIEIPKIPATIGRGDDCDVKAPVKGVSRRHCQLFDDGGNLSVKDLKSSNGTYVNGARIDQGLLVAGDVIKLGDISLSVQIDGQPPADAAKPAAKPQPPADILDENTDSSDSADDFISMMFDNSDEDED